MKKTLWVLVVFVLCAGNALSQTLEIVTGAPQLDVSPSAQQPFVVRARDAGGNSIAGQNIIWFLSTGATSSTGSIDGTPVAFNPPNNRVLKTTDAQGVSAVTFVNSAQPNAAVAVSACFAAGTPAAPSIGSPCSNAFIIYQPGLTLQSGNNQTGPVGLPLPQPLSVRVTPTASNSTNPSPVGIPGITVNWQTFTAANPSPVSLGSIVSDANGFANLSFTPPDTSPNRTVRALVTSNNAPDAAEISFTVSVQIPTLNCTPTYSVSPVPTGQAVVLQGNCTVNGNAATTGVEQWAFPAASGAVVNGAAASSATRAIGSPPLQVTFSNPGNFTPTLTFSVDSVTTPAINAPVTVTPPPAVACTPRVSPSPAISGQTFTIEGNCTANGTAAAAGTETWTIPALDGQAAITLTRVLPAAVLQRTIATPGIYSFGLQFTTPSGVSPTYSVPVTISQSSASAVPDLKTLAQIADAVRANTMASMAGMRAQLGNVQSRIRTLRQGSTAGWINDTTIQINGRSIPVPSPGAGTNTSGSKQSSDPSGGSPSSSAPARSEELDATQSRAWGAYIMGTVAVEELKGSSGFEVSTNGITVGADYRFSRQMAVGGAVGYSKSTSDLSGLTDAQRATGKSLTFYGSFEPKAKWYIDTAISVMRNNFKLKRNTTLSTLTNAETKGSGTGLSVTSGYQFLRDALIFSPYVRVDALDVGIDGFTEAGENALTVGDQGLKSTVATLGGEAQYIIPTSGAIVIPHARLEIQQQTQNSARAVTAQLVGSTVQVIVDPHLETDKSFGFFSVGVSVQFKRGLSAFADYEQLFGKSNFSEQRANIGLKLEF
jgi:uncharacterized protein YhjY with autotransporter beta-barrel domain